MIKKRIIVALIFVMVGLSIPAYSFASTILIASPAEQISYIIPIDKANQGSVFLMRPGESKDIYIRVCYKDGRYHVLTPEEIKSGEARLVPIIYGKNIFTYKGKNLANYPITIQALEPGIVLFDVYYKNYVCRASLTIREN